LRRFAGKNERRLPQQKHNCEVLLLNTRSKHWIPVHSFLTSGAHRVFTRLPHFPLITLISSCIRLFFTLSDACGELLILFIIDH
jgi:hypothetical protein